MKHFIHVYVPDDVMRDLSKIASVLGLDVSDVLVACFRIFCSQINLDDLESVI